MHSLLLLLLVGVVTVEEVEPRAGGTYVLVEARGEPDNQKAARERACEYAEEVHGWRWIRDLQVDEGPDHFSVSFTEGDGTDSSDDFLRGAVCAAR